MLSVILATDSIWIVRITGLERRYFEETPERELRAAKLLLINYHVMTTSGAEIMLP